MLEWLVFGISCSGQEVSGDARLGLSEHLVGTWLIKGRPCGWVVLGCLLLVNSSEGNPSNYWR
jgi:hypothetical protein